MKADGCLELQAMPWPALTRMLVIVEGNICQTHRYFSWIENMLAESNILGETEIQYAKSARARCF